MKRLSGVMMVSLLLVAGCSKEKKSTGTPPAPSGPTAGIPGEYEEPGAATPVEEEPKAATAKELAPNAIIDLVADVFAALNARDAERVAGLYTDDAILSVVDGGVSFKGGMDVANNLYAPGLWQPFPDLRFEPQMILVNGMNAIAIVRITGTNSADFPEHKATNKKVGFISAFHFVFDDKGKITAEFHVMDPLTLMAQLGLIGPPMPLPDVSAPGLLEVDRLTVSAQDSKTENENVASVMAFEDAIMDGKVDEALAQVDDGIVLSANGAAEEVRGKAELEKGLNRLNGAFGNIKRRTQTYLPAGDYVASISEYTMVNTGDVPELNVKASGRMLKLTDYSVYHLKDGKIDRAYAFRNGKAFTDQLGVELPPPGQPAEKGKEPKKPAKKGKKPQK